MGEVVEKGSQVGRVKVGDRVVAAVPVACGECAYCKQGN